MITSLEGNALLVYLDSFGVYVIGIEINNIKKINISQLKLAFNEIYIPNVCTKRISE